MSVVKTGRAEVQWVCCVQFATMWNLSWLLVWHNSSLTKKKALNEGVSSRCSTRDVVSCLYFYLLVMTDWLCASPVIQSCLKSWCWFWTCSECQKKQNWYRQGEGQEKRQRKMGWTEMNVDDWNRSIMCVSPEKAVVKYILHIHLWGATSFLFYFYRNVITCVWPHQ